MDDCELKSIKAQKTRQELLPPPELPKRFHIQGLVQKGNIRRNNYNEYKLSMVSGRDDLQAPESIFLSVSRTFCVV